MNIFLTFKEIGIYQACYFSIHSIASFLATGLVFVFFPFSSSYGDKKALFGQIGRVLRTVPLILIAIMAVSSVALFLYGKIYRSFQKPSI